MHRSIPAVVTALLVVTSVAFVGVGAVAAQESDADASLSEQTTGGHTVVVDEVTVPDGGFVTVHDSTVTEGRVFESVRGTSDYLEPGNHRGVEVTLDTPYEEDGTVIAMPHFDTNGNERYDFVDEEGSAVGPYTEGGDPVLDDAQLTVETDGETGDGDDADENLDGSQDDGAGFGAVVALLAILGAVMATRRRS